MIRFSWESLCTINSLTHYAWSTCCGPSFVLLLGIYKEQNRASLSTTSFPAPSTLSSPWQVLLILPDPTQTIFFFLMSLDELGALLSLPTEPCTHFLSHLFAFLQISGLLFLCILRTLSHAWHWAGTQKLFLEIMNVRANEWMNEWGKASKSSLHAVFMTSPFCLSLQSTLYISDWKQRRKVRKTASGWGLTRMHRGHLEKGRLVGSEVNCNTSKNCGWAGVVGQECEGDPEK